MNRSRTSVSITEEMKAAAEAEILEQSKRIEFYLTEYSLELLASKMHSGDFLVPAYQRISVSAYQREFTWETERKSKFIESLAMGLPIPFLFFWEMDDGKLEIVDGSQRLRTIEEFILGGFRLGNLESLPKLSHFCFTDLLESRQRKIKNRSIRGIVLNEHADEQARFDMFERINTGSKKANKAEVRRGALSGPFMELVIELAKMPDFIKLAPISESLRKERGYEELVTRFFAYGDGLENYKDRPSDFLFIYTKKMNVRFQNNPQIGEQYKDRFVKMITFVDLVFQHGFQRTANGKATPRSRFEAISIGSYFALQEQPQLAQQPPDVNDWIEGSEFKKIIGSDGANAIARLRGRIKFVRDRLLEK